MSDTTDLSQEQNLIKELARLEHAIGVPSWQGLLANITANNRFSVQAWLTTKKLSYSGVFKARDASLLRAYNNYNYFNVWLSNEQNRTPKTTSSHSNQTLDFFDLEFDTTAASKKSTSNSNALDVEQIETIAREAAKHTIKLDVPALVAAELENKNVTISANVKAQIKALAIAAAIEQIEANKQPSTIEIYNPETETRKNIGVQHFKFPTLLRACCARLPNGFRPNVWLTGPAGSGKTTAAEKVAEALNMPFASNGSLDADYKVVGFKDANGNFQSTEFLSIFENGGIYCADEIDNWHSGALLALNAGLANGFIATPRGMIKRHPDCIVIACANTWGLGANSEYVGRVKLDAASLDRFFPKIDWPIDEQLERAIATKLKWCNLVQATRSKAKKHGLKILITPRATFAGCALLEAGFTLYETINMTLAAGLSSQQLTSIGLSDVADLEEYRD
jgi:hypothetical protein